MEVTLLALLLTKAENPIYAKAVASNYWLMVIAPGMRNLWPFKSSWTTIPTGLAVWD